MLPILRWLEPALEKAEDKSAGSSTGSAGGVDYDPLWSPGQVAQRLNVSPDWVRDHSSRKEPRLPCSRPSVPSVPRNWPSLKLVSKAPSFTTMASIVCPSSVLRLCGWVAPPQTLPCGEQGPRLGRRSEPRSLVLSHKPARLEPLRGFSLAIEKTGTGHSSGLGVPDATPGRDPPLVADLPQKKSCSLGIGYSPAYTHMYPIPHFVSDLYLPSSKSERNLRTLPARRHWGWAGQRFAGRQLCVEHGIDRSRHGLHLLPNIDLHLGGIEGIETYFNGFPGKLRRSFVEHAAQQEGGVPAHESIQAIEEQAT